MDKKLEPIVQALQEKFSTSFEEFRGEVHVFVNPADIIEALTLLRDKYDFELLSAMTAVDYWPQQSPRFHVIYQLTSLAQNTVAAVESPGRRRQIPGSRPRPVSMKWPTGASASSWICSASLRRSSRPAHSLAARRLG